MYTGQADVVTYLIYIFMGLFCWFSVKVFLRTGARSVQKDGLLAVGSREDRIEHYLAAGLFVLVLALFAALRKVGSDLGGSDAAAYEDYFKHATSFAYHRENPYNISEPVFFLYNFLFRKLTGNVRVFFFFTYAFIAASYLLFIRAYAKDTEVASPYLLLVFLYLKAFCTLRTSFSVACFLIALVVFKKHKLLSTPLFFIPVFIHRMSLLYAILPIFYWFYRFVNKRTTVLERFLVYASCLVCSVAGSILLREFILRFNVISGLDASYIESSGGLSLLGRYPMYFSFILLIILLRIYIPLSFSKQKSCALIDDDLFFLFVFDVIVFPASLIFGMWRANEYLYVSRLALWSVSFPLLVNLSFGKYKRILYPLFSAAFVLWLGFRLFSEWEALKIMPYLPFFG